MADENQQTEDDYIEEQVEQICFDFMKYPKSVCIAICDYDGEIIKSPVKGYAARKYARILAPFTKRCKTVAKCLEPMSEPVAFSIWTRRAVYTAVIEKDVFGFGVQQAIKLPFIPPKPMEEISETERNEKRDKEIRIIKRMREDKAKAKAEAERKAQEREERLKRKKALLRLQKGKKPEKKPEKKKEEVEEEVKEEGEEKEERESMMGEEEGLGEEEEEREEGEEQPEGEGEGEGGEGGEGAKEDEEGGGGGD